MNALFFFIAATLCALVLPRVKPGIPWICPVLALALPFCAGGIRVPARCCRCFCCWPWRKPKILSPSIGTGAVSP